MCRSIRSTGGGRARGAQALGGAGATDDYILKHGLFGSQRAAVARELDRNEREIAAICGLLKSTAVPNRRARTSCEGHRRAGRVPRERAPVRHGLRDLLASASRSRWSTQIDAGLLRRRSSAASSPTVAEKPQGRRGAGQRPIDTIATPCPRRRHREACSARNMAAVVRRLAADNIGSDDAWLPTASRTRSTRRPAWSTARRPRRSRSTCPTSRTRSTSRSSRRTCIAVQAIYFAVHAGGDAHASRWSSASSSCSARGCCRWAAARPATTCSTTTRRPPSASPRPSAATCTCALSVRRAGPAVGIQPNREFNELWLRFVSAVSNFARQHTVERLLRNAMPMSVTQEQVRKAGARPGRQPLAQRLRHRLLRRDRPAADDQRVHDASCRTPRCAARSVRATCGR